MGGKTAIADKIFYRRITNVMCAPEHRPKHRGNPGKTVKEKFRS